MKYCRSAVWADPWRRSRSELGAGGSEVFWSKGTTVQRWWSNLVYLTNRKNTRLLGEAGARPHRVRNAIWSLGTQREVWGFSGEYESSCHLAALWRMNWSSLESLCSVTTVHYSSGWNALSGSRGVSSFLRISRELLGTNGKWPEWIWRVRRGLRA